MDERCVCYENENINENINENKMPCQSLIISLLVRYASEFYKNNNLQLYLLHMVPHVGFLYSAVDNSRIPCGLQMALSFYLSEGAFTNTSCIRYDEKREREI